MRCYRAAEAGSDTACNLQARRCPGLTTKHLPGLTCSPARWQQWSSIHCSQNHFAGAGLAGFAADCCAVPAVCTGACCASICMSGKPFLLMWTLSLHFLMWHSAIRSQIEGIAARLCANRHCLVLTSDVQGLVDVLHEAETFGTKIPILGGSAAQRSHIQKLLFSNGTYCKLRL